MALIRRRRAVDLLLVTMLIIPTTALLAEEPTVGCPGVPWPATDGLGRSLPLSAEVGPPRSDRFVGIFYFLWHEARRRRSPHLEGPYDISRILEREPDALRKPASPLWGEIGTYHYWGEPLHGYYLSDDPWVLRRHAWLLADAGVDTLIFDTTNAVTYREAYRELCEVFSEMRRRGGRTPQIAFMVNTRAGQTAQRIYEDVYRPGDYSELWFRWRGKPLMLCDPAEASAGLRDFFTLRRAHWPFTMVNTPHAWHWESAFPQPYGYTDDPDEPEQVNVSVAQNLRRSDGKVTNMSSGNARGRSFHGGRVERAPGAVDRGYNFQEQWERALELDPPFVMVTGWNEWIAGRWGKPEGPLVFVDQFDQEHSRDIEPARVGHRDSYFWQLVANIRRYKGAPPLPATSPPASIDIGGGFESWRAVLPVYRDHEGETTPRDHAGAAGLRYVNSTGRNDILVARVARDSRHIYFYLRTRAAIVPSPIPRGLWLLIDGDCNASTGWEGFDFIANRSIDGEGTSWVERNEGGWSWKRLAPVRLRAERNELHLAIPRPVLGLPESGTRVTLDFKWADNLQRPGDPLDLYLSGDVAPEGRYTYRYAAE